jgi:hypothetical protein
MTDMMDTKFARLIALCLVVHGNMSITLFPSTGAHVPRWLKYLFYAFHHEFIVLVISSIDPKFHHEIISLYLAVILFIHPSQKYYLSIRPKTASVTIQGASIADTKMCYYFISENRILVGVVPPVSMFFFVGE